MKNGSLIISLDFELFWGILDAVNYDQNVDRLLKTRAIAIDLINFFEEEHIRVTWSTVGLLMMEDNQEYQRITKGIRPPSYDDKQYNNYNNYEDVYSSDKYTDEVFFAKPIVEKLKNTDYQTIGSHTFSHFYCLEKVENIEDFDYDLKLAKEVASNNNIELSSIVFPRNQYDIKAIDTILNNDIYIYRGNPDHYIYKSRRKSNVIIRLFRLLDTYINITGYNAYSIEKDYRGAINIKASRFLRPIKKLKTVTSNLQLKRIKKEMTYAAKNNLYYHLWWHPHNFSRNTEENILMLKEIIKHYKFLEGKYNFSSESMESFADRMFL